MTNKQVVNEKICDAENLNKESTENQELPIGKLDSKLLQNLVFRHLTYRRGDVKERPAIGLDCATLDFGDFDCIISSDPISAATNDIGRLAVHINCNDIATQGVAPMAMTLVLLLPKGTTRKQLEDIMIQAGSESEALGVEIVGGHTEITDAVNTPVAVATCFGKSLSGRENPEMKPGDKVLMSKLAGLEGTAIVCSDAEDKLTFLSEDEINRGKSLMNQLSVVKEGIISGEVGACGMHDVTEGGILGAVWEICQVANLGVNLYEDKIPVDPVTIKLAQNLGFNYLRLISSGSMIIVAEKDKAEEIIKHCKDAGINVTEIGEMKPASDGCNILLDPKRCGNNGDSKTTGDRWQNIDPPAGDHLYKALENLNK